MRYWIIFGTTLIIVVLILFVNPKSKYLDIFEYNFTVDYEKIESAEGYNWTYEYDKDYLTIKEYSDTKWIFTPKKNGSTKIVFRYVNDEGDELYKIDYLVLLKRDKIYWKESKAIGLYDYPNLY